MNFAECLSKWLFGRSSSERTPDYWTACCRSWDYFTEPLPSPCCQTNSLPALRPSSCHIEPPNCDCMRAVKSSTSGAGECPRLNFACALVARFQSLRWLDNKKQLLVYYHAAQLNERQDSVLAALRQARGAPSPQALSVCVCLFVCMRVRVVCVFCVRPFGEFYKVWVGVHGWVLFACE